MNQAVHAQRHQGDGQEHQADGERGGNEVDVAHIERAVQEGVVRQQAVAHPQNQAVGAVDENVGEDDGEQQRQEAEIQDNQQRGGHQDIGSGAEFGGFGVHDVAVCKRAGLPEKRGLGFR